MESRITLDTLKARHAELSTEHAALWRQVSMSPAWQQLSKVEGGLAELERMITSLDQKEVIADAG